MTPAGLRAGLVFAALLAVFVVATLPMAAALHWSGLAARGFSARAAEGSVWSGTVNGAAIGALRLGDLQMRLAPGALLNGSAGFSFAPAAPGAILPRGRMVFSDTGVSAAGIEAQLPLAALLPHAGADAVLAVADFGFGFADGRCVRAGGAATAEAALQGLQTSVVLSGTPVCDGTALLLPLSGRTADGDAGLSLRVAADGGYTYDLTLVTADPVMQAALVASGFAAGGGGYRLSGSGQL